MTLLELVQQRLAAIVDLGGPVVALLLVLSVLSLAVMLYKLWQYGVQGVGRHRAMREALTKYDGGDLTGAQAALGRSRNHLAPLIARAMRDAGLPGMQARIEAEAAAKLDLLERGFRILDSIAQVAPLLGLFGTVLGMIDAFQALQETGSSVDPSTLAGGIWVALLTTAAGLAVAMPTSLMLTFFESRVARERGIIEMAIETAFCPISNPGPDPVPATPGNAAPEGRPAHAG